MDTCGGGGGIVQNLSVLLEMKENVGARHSRINTLSTGGH